jgi:hypothetical protein
MPRTSSTTCVPSARRLNIAYDECNRLVSSFTLLRNARSTKRRRRAPGDKRIQASADGGVSMKLRSVAAGILTALCRFPDLEHQRNPTTILAHESSGADGEVGNRSSLCYRPNRTARGSRVKPETRVAS